ADQRQPVGKRACRIELRVHDHHLATAIHVPPASVLSNQEKAAALLARSGRLDPATCRQGEESKNRCPAHRIASQWTLQHAGRRSTIHTRALRLRAVNTCT